MQLLKNFLTRLNNKHILSLTGNGIMSLLSIVTVGVLCRYISVAEYGTWVFFQSTLLLIDTFRSGFLTTAFIKFYSGASEERRLEITGSSWYIALLITAGLSIAVLPALFFLHHIQNQGLKLFFEWFSICFWVMLPYFIASCIVQAEQRFDRLLYLRLMNQGSFIIFILILTFVHTLTLRTIIYAYLLSFALPGIFVLASGWAGIKTLKNRSRKSISELYHFGKFSVGTTISSNLFRTSDTFIINFMLGPAALGIYNIGQRLMEIVEIPLRSFAATGMPSLSTAFNQDKREEVILIMKKYTGMLSVALVPACIAAFIFADFVVALIGGQQYLGTEAANVFRLFMTFALLYPADRFLALTLDVIHQPKINFIKVLVMLAVNIAADLIGIYTLGNIYGVALATFFPVLIGMLIGYWALNKYLPFSFWSMYSTGYSECKFLLQQNLLRFKTSA